MSYDPETDFIDKVEVDVCRRVVRLYSDQGNYQMIECTDAPETFVNLVGLIRDTCGEDIVYYYGPAVTQ